MLAQTCLFPSAASLVVPTFSVLQLAMARPIKPTTAVEPDASNGPARAAQPAATSGPARAAQPAATNFQSLKMLLSKQSAKIGQFKVIVFKPWTDTYTYEWEGKRRETTAWRCTLVSVADPTLYCVGEFKLTAKNKVAYEKNETTNKHGTTLIMSNVALVDTAKTQYMGCSVRVTVNMPLTKLTGVLAAASAVQPVPKTTVAQTPQVQQNQNFDLTACVLSRSSERNAGEGRKVFNLELADGSKDEASGKVQTISLSVFAGQSEAATVTEFVDKSISQKDPVTFFNIRGSKNADQDAYLFCSARKCFSMIVAESPHALEMRTRTPELYNLTEKSPVPQTQWPAQMAGSI